MIGTKRKIWLCAYVTTSLLALTLLFAPKTMAFSGGAGTVGDPYQVTTAAELASLSSYLGSGHSSKYYKLMNNIDLSGYNGGASWTPIGTQSSRFFGKFDGNYKTISNLYLNSTYALGLFGEIGSSGQVSNLLLTDVNITGSSSGIGSLAGSNYGTVTKVGVSGGSVTGIQRVGGLVGSNQGGMSYVFSDVSVYFNPTSSPTCCAGGIAGEVAFGGSSATLTNSYSRSSLTMTYNIYNQGSVGGALGNDYSSGTKSNLYSTGAITMVSGNFPSNTGGLSGGSYGTVSSSYWDTETSGRATSNGGAGVVGKTTSQMKTESTYSGWDFDSVWDIDLTGTINDGYPYLQWQTLTDTNATPDAPTSLGSSSMVDQSWGTDTTPEFSFSLSDDNVADTLQYQIQIDDSSDFASPIVDYTSALSTQGSKSFTVGQVAGGGTYSTGSASTTLSDGLYYWRVKAIDNSSATSSYSTANSGEAAFGIDLSDPTTPGTPTTTTPTTDTTPAWAWSASTDDGAGLDTPAYIIEWSQDSDFVDDVTLSSANSNSYTHSTELADGTWYYRIKATDALGNESAYSSSGSVVIDTTDPGAPGVPTTDSPTIDTTPQWEWDASVDSGSGLHDTPYTIYYSTAEDFSTGSFATSATNNYTHTSDLTEGRWYARVNSRDQLSNTSDYSDVGSVLIDLTNPTVPGKPVSISSNTNRMPTWNWTASSDSGSGLADNAYIVQWSKKSNFSSGVSEATIDTNSFTIPTNLDLGKWYFRAKSIDNVSRESSYSVAGNTTIVEESVDESEAETNNISDESESSENEQGLLDDGDSFLRGLINQNAKANYKSKKRRQIVINAFPEYSQEGKQLKLDTGTVIYFCVNGEPDCSVDQKHSITVDKIDIRSMTVTVTVRSEPQVHVFSIKDAKLIDVNRDGLPDIEITLNDVLASTASFAFKEPGVTMPTSQESTNNQSTKLNLLFLLFIGFLTATVVGSRLHKLKRD